jgi:transmembrane sensor
MTLSDNQYGKPDRLEHEANRWVAQLVSGEATTADAESLRKWRRQSPAHEDAYVAATQHWQIFGPAAQGLLQQGMGPVWTPPNPRLGRRAALGGLGLAAACMAGYGMARSPFDFWPSITELTADYRTAKGEQRQITLTDNVSVRLNTQTSLTLNSAPAEKGQVKLLSGEAAFSTTSGTPLIVVAGEGRTTTAGQASFEVRNIGATVCVTCLDGNIQVQQGGKVAELQAKQQIHYDAAGLQQAATIDPAEAGAWQSGFLIFRFTPLSDVIAEVNRYRPGKVVLMNAALGANPVNGRFRIQHIDDVVIWVEQAFGASVTSLPGRIVLLS